MPKTRKNETEATPSVAAPVRRRAANAGTAARKPTASRERAPKAVAPQATVESEPITATVVETVVAKPVSVEPIVSAEPSFEQIAALAYSYWVNRGYQGGSPEQDWLAAERELRLTAIA